MSTEQNMPPTIGFGIIAGILSAIVIYTMVAWLLWQIPIPYELTAFKQHLMYWSAMTLNEWFPPLMQSMADHYRLFLQKLPEGHSAVAIHVRFYLAGILGAGVGGYVGYLAGKPQPTVRHVKGRQLKKGNEAKALANSHSQEEGKLSGAGLKLNPHLSRPMSLNRESRHIMAIGASGSGKTTIITPLIQAAIERGDQLIIYDNKGDFTEWVKDAILLAPWDARSHALDIAKDCRNAQQARELAAHLIPEGTDPIWHQAARQVLTALVIKLQAEKPETWNWRDLYRLVCGSHEELLSIMEAYTPEASNILKAPGKTAQSVLMHLSANAWLISDLANAWGDAPLENRFSVTDWMKNPNAKDRVVILQGSANYSILSNAYIQLVFSLACGLINSPEISKSSERKLWFFLDEFPQLGKLERFRSLLEIGRSKGVRVVLACQDISQIREIYGEHATNSWLSTVGTQIFTRMGAGETANFVAEKMIGYKTFDRIIVNGDEHSAPVRERELVFEPSEFNDELGTGKNGVSALVLGFKEALILNWPYAEPEKIREASELAAWLYRQPRKVVTDDQPDQVNQPGKARIKLRKPTAEQMREMALSGSDMRDAGEDADDMSVESVGGSHESR